MSQRGSTKKRGSTWTAYWFVRDPEGRRVQRSKGGFATKREAQAHLTDTLSAVQSGTYSEPTKLTVAQYLRDHWLPTRTQRPSTVASYTFVSEQWLIPNLGGVLLAQVTPGHVQGLVDELRGTVGRTGEPISPRSVQYAVVVLRMALEQAAKQSFIPRNPAAMIERPRAKAPEMKAWTGDEAGKFLAFVQDERLYCLWLLGLSRGFRRGELVGLRWTDVDLDAGRVKVLHTRVLVTGKAGESAPKTARGRRSVPLDDQLVAALRTHRRHQLEERMAWGEAWQDSGYVFTREDGSPLRPDYVSKALVRLAERAGVTVIRFHDMRHTCATLALKAGIPTEVVSRWLGHSSVSITQDIYQHEIPSMMEEAGAQLTALVLGHD